MFLHQFHGGIQDGLVLPHQNLIPRVILPRDVVISNVEDYNAWDPKAGDPVNMYVMAGESTLPENSRYYHHHLYLEGPLILEELPPR